MCNAWVRPLQGRHRAHFDCSLNAMLPSARSHETVRKHLERVLASPGFARNQRLSIPPDPIP